MGSLAGIKLSKPTFEDKVPSSGVKVKLTPFRVGDEKNLLIAAQSQSTHQMNLALKSVIANCVTGVKVEDLEQYDLEYLFLKIRAKSVGEFSTVGLNCSQCETTNEIKIDLETVVVDQSKQHSDMIKIEDKLAFKMKLPDTEQLEKIDLTDPESVMDVIVLSVETVYTGEESIEVGPSDREELKQLIESMTSTQFQKFQDYFDTMPKLKKEIDFVCGSCGHENHVTLEGLASFF